MEYTFNLFHPDRYDQIFGEIIKLPKDLHHDDIFHRIMKSFDGIPIFTIPFDNKISGLPVYRVTQRYQGLEDLPKSPKRFSYPKCPRIGRANLEGIPVFYCSISGNTAVSEMKNLASEPYFISRWRLKFPRPIQISILLQNVEPNSTTAQGVLGGIVQNKINNWIKDIPEDKRVWFNYKLRRFSDLFTQKGDKYYHLSSAIAHSYIFGLKGVGAQVPILIYPSVTKLGKDTNFAIDPDLADNPDYLEIESVIKSNLSLNDSGKFQGNLMSKAIMISGELEWKKLTVERYDLITDKILIKIDQEEGSHIIDPEKYNVTRHDYGGSLKKYILKYYDFSRFNFNSNISKILKNHDIFDKNLTYSGELLLILEFDETLRINFNGDHHLKSAGLRIKYMFEFK